MTNKANELNNCIIDARVSTTKQLDGNGLDSQRNICMNYAKTNQWNVCKVFEKAYSGRKEEREDFEEIIDYLRNQKKAGTPIQYYLFKSIDRFTRDGAVTFSEMKDRVEQLGVIPVDVYGVIQPKQNKLGHLGISYDWSMSSPTEVAQLIEAQRAKQEVSDILTRMIGAEIELTRNGYKVRQANDGYLNEKVYVNGRKRTIQVADPKRADYFKTMFSMRAKGTFSDQEIVDQVNAMGYTSKDKNKWSKGTNKQIVGITKGKPLTVKAMQKLMQRPIYAGVICEKWTNHQPIKAQYEGLVSIDTFNKANKGKVFIQERKDGTLSILYDYQPQKEVRKYKQFKPEYKYDKMIYCPQCKTKPLMTSASTGKSGKRFPAYHCHRGHYVRIPQERFEQTIDQLIKNITVTEEGLKGIDEFIMETYEEHTTKVKARAKTTTNSLKELIDKQAMYIEAYASSSNPTIQKNLEEKINELETRIKEASSLQNATDMVEHSIADFKKGIDYFAKHFKGFLMNNRNPKEQLQTFGLVFDRTPTYAEIESGTPQYSWFFNVLENKHHGKSLLANQRRLKWNTIYEWMERLIAFIKKLESPDSM